MEMIMHSQKSDFFVHEGSESLQMIWKKKLEKLGFSFKPNKYYINKDGRVGAYTISSPIITDKINSLDDILKLSKELNCGIGIRQYKNKIKCTILNSKVY